MEGPIILDLGGGFVVHQNSSCTTYYIVHKPQMRRMYGLFTYVRWKHRHMNKGEI